MCHVPQLLMKADLAAMEAVGRAIARQLISYSVKGKPPVAYTIGVSSHRGSHITSVAQVLLCRFIA